MLGKGRGYINVQCPNDQAPETGPVETRLFLLFPTDLLDEDAAGLAVSSGLDSQDFCEKCTKKTITISPSPSSRSPPLCPSSSRRTWQGRLQTRQVAIKKSQKKGRRERFLKTSPKVNGKVTTPVSRSMLIRAPTPRDPDGSKMLFLGEIKFF